ncbi:MAG TPA: helix-turn-helix domain-containing protein [Candidatus Deferrimicrobium sp.]|nr:helix-turn-helix domain-containing protein [Candidatus Deferrimicrobium sp.]
MKRELDKLSHRVVEYILTSDIKELATLSEEKIAKIFARNPVYISRKFKLEQNISIPQFILREKIHRIVFALDEDKDISIAELSRRFGFLSMEQFDREFINYLAIDPRKYKELKAKK